MPIIKGADLSSVSTDFELYPPGAYKVEVKSSEMSENGKNLLIKTEIVECDTDQKYIGKNFTHFINLETNAGDRNEIGLQTLKRYLEAVFGKKSPEADVADSDPLNGHLVTLVLGQRPDKNDKELMRQDVKKILPA